MKKKLTFYLIMMLIPIEAASSTDITPNEITAENLSLICGQNLSSIFNMDDEGWTAINGANLSWKSRGGCPGGFISGEDTNSENIWYYVSPRSWSGNWTQYIGGNLSFDMRQIYSGDGYNDNFADMLIIHGLNNSSLSWPGVNSSWPVEPTMSWTHYEIGLLASNFGVNESEFINIMDNVSNILIRGEFSNKGDIEGLDNVFVQSVNFTTRSDYSNLAHLGFYRNRTSVTSGLTDRDGSGEGTSYSNINGNTVRLYCEDNIWGTHSASAKIWDEFVYDDLDHMNRIILNARIKGAMTLLSAPIRIQSPGILGDLFKPIVSPKGSTDINVYMTLRDITDGIDIDRKLLYEKASGDATFFDETIDELASEYIDAKLFHNHTYQVILEASISSSAEGISGLVADFSSQQMAHGISWNYDEVKWI